MQKGYSRELMEEFYKEEQKHQEEVKEREALKQKQKQKADLNFKLELLLGKIEQAEEEITLLNKKLSHVRTLAIIAIALAVIVAAVGLSEAFAELAYYLP